MGGADAKAHSVRDNAKPLAGLAKISCPTVGHLVRDKGKVARLTGLEPATPGVTGRYSNQLSYNRAGPSGSF